MNHKQFVPPLAHATADPNHKSATARSRSTRHGSGPVKTSIRSEQNHGAERLVLGIVWGAVAGLFAVAMLTDAFVKPRRQLTRYEKTLGRARELNSRMNAWWNS